MFPTFVVEKELECLYLMHRKQEAIVSDNGPEFQAMTLPEGVSNRFIEPGSPWQNGHIESFFGKLRDELLNMEICCTGRDLKDHYSKRRQHSTLGNLTPAK